MLKDNVTCILEVSLDNTFEAYLIQTKHVTWKKLKLSLLFIGTQRIYQCHNNSICLYIH